MDHTLLNDNLEITEENCVAIGKALDQGIQFVICTGRGIYGIEHYMQQLGIANRNGYAICQNGGTVYQLPKGNLILERSFEAEAFYPIAALAHKYQVDIQMYYDRILMAEKMTPRIEKYRRTMGTEITIVPDAMKYQGKLTKCLLNGARENLEKVKQEAACHLAGLNMFFSNYEFLEFTALDANKGNAMISLAHSLGIKKEEIMAIGDSDNDISMLQAAGLGIAVANAVPQVKKVADKIMMEDCNQHAIQAVIEQYIL